MVAMCSIWNTMLPYGTPKFKISKLGYHMEHSATIWNTVLPYGTHCYHMEHIATIWNIARNFSRGTRFPDLILTACSMHGTHVYHSWNTRVPCMEHAFFCKRNFVQNFVRTYFKITITCSIWNTGMVHMDQYRGKITILACSIWNMFDAKLYSHSAPKSGADSCSIWNTVIS